MARPRAGRAGRPRTGGYHRSPFAAAERECAAWFLEQCAPAASTSSATARQPGRLVAARAGAHGPTRSLTGSHLDSVLDGGAYDGPLGVVSALAAIDLLRDRGFAPDAADRRRRVRRGGGVPVRHGLPRLPARDRRDRPGAGPRAAGPRRRLAARRDGAAGLEPRVGPRDLLDRGRLLRRAARRAGARPGRPGRGRSGVAAAIWPHGRWRFDFTGEPNHAGTTAMEDRHDPMLTYAMTVLAANKQARLAGQRATFGRVDVQPNGTNAIPSAGDRLARRARPTSAAHSRRCWPTIERPRQERAGRDGTALLVTAESVSPAVRLRRRPGPARSRPLGGLAGDPDGGRPRRRHPLGRRRSRPRCCSCATRPASRTRRASTPRPPTAWPASRRSPTCWRGSPRDDLLARAGLDRRRAIARRGARSTSRTASSPGVVAAAAPDGAERLPGLTVPGLANCHSHAFHRALRGRTQRGRGTFWTWREQMYDVAARLTPDTLLRAGAGDVRGDGPRPGSPAVGEFHYLHHGPGGTPYDEPNAMVARAGRGRPRGRAADRPAGHVLPRLGDRGGAGGGAGAVQRRRRGRVGDPSSTAFAQAAAGRPWSARRSTRCARCPRDQTWQVAAGPSCPRPRCTCTSPSRSPRTTPAWRRTG